MRKRDANLFVLDARARHRVPGATQRHRRRRWWCVADPGPRLLKLSQMAESLSRHDVRWRNQRLEPPHGRAQVWRSSRFHQTHRVNLLVYCENYTPILEARERERVLKRWRRERKFQLIEAQNPDWHDLTNQIG